MNLRWLDKEFVGCVTKSLWFHGQTMTVTLYNGAFNWMF